jgi:hypothetical protein
MTTVRAQASLADSVPLASTVALPAKEQNIHVLLDVRQQLLPS